MRTKILIPILLIFGLVSFASATEVLPDSMVGSTIEVSQGFKSAHWQCYDGFGENPSGNDCLTMEEWKEKAESNCEERCNSDGEKCGIDIFGVSDECLLEAPEIKEEVKCIFANSDKEQVCNGADMKFKCSGVEACVTGVAGKKGQRVTWKSSCGGYAYTVLDGSNEYANFDCGVSDMVKETVKCSFSDSSSEQKCYTTDGHFGCSGFGSCKAQVSGNRNRELTWKSSCGGYAYTLIDGEDQEARFRCEVVEQPIIKELVKCIFSGSGKMEKCYSEDKRFKCSGVNTCDLDVYGKKGERIIWRSSCGIQTSVTVVDGFDEYAQFKCIQEHEVPKVGFRYAYWQCYDGFEDKEGSETTCKPGDYWKNLARRSCKEHCYREKCGANTLRAWEECKLGEGIAVEEYVEEEVISLPAEQVEEVVSTEVEEVEEQMPPSVETCRDGCSLNDRCYPFGYRKGSKYCSDQGFVEQQKENDFCENNFECSTNLCVDGKCMSKGLLQKIFNWFGRWFG